ncbi:hypothetical protein [Mycobacterium sp.]|uniref:hypothetical protein n=1 Tax=Mycobacterium sp. TaxID=1785 RepID=UPI002BFDB057|nr:hypothetical protein [Mycobacterium sp.]HME46814.1 hypothetical protein [Mycobacterium sp.]
MASAGVAITYRVVRVPGSISSLLLIVVAFSFALGLDPATSRLVNGNSLSTRRTTTSRLKTTPR